VYVFPKIGGGSDLGGGAAAAETGTVNFATILVPGPMASMLLMQGITAVAFPLVMEFSWQRTIEDRVLAPVPVWGLMVQKITAGAVQSFIGATIVFPIVLLVHAAGQAPRVHVTNWALSVLILVAASLTARRAHPGLGHMPMVRPAGPGRRDGGLRLPGHPHLHPPRPRLSRILN
jgi:ABC-2 type transport system permease protein